MSPYDVLHVSSMATEEEIRMAYKAMVCGLPCFLIRKHEINVYFGRVFFFFFVWCIGEKMASG